MNPLERLRRSDKWFLGGGNGAIYAPPFPKHVTAPGFWDECFLADIQIPRLFGVLFLDLRGRPIRMHSQVENWQPDRLLLRHQSPDVEIYETRVVTAKNAWTSEFEIRRAYGHLHVFQWGLFDVQSDGPGTPWQSVTEVAKTDDSICVRLTTHWPRQVAPDRTAVEGAHDLGSGDALPGVHVYLELGSSHARRSWTINLAQRHDTSPLYELSVLPELFAHGHLPGDFKHLVGPAPIDGLLHVVQHHWAVAGDRIVLACGSGLTPDAARESLLDARMEGVGKRSALDWESYFHRVPKFDSSDPFLTAAYWNRWAGLRLNTVNLPGLPIQGSDGNFAPFVTEGVGFFRNFVTYSAQAHLREVSWMRDPSLAGGILDNLVAVQREDGSFPGHTYSARPARDFYHADFAAGLEQLHRIHPGAVGKEHLGALRRYADYMVRSRTVSPDRAAPTLYEIFDQNETGQEYMSRYAFARPDADEWGSFAVGGVDATTYAANLFRVLADFRAADSTYRAYYKGARAGLLERSYDPDAGFFCDVARDGTRSPARPATGLFPLLLPLAGMEKQASRAVEWLVDQSTFWLPKGFPATSETDPTFRAQPEWRDKRLNCPWNGRSWPMVNCHLVDGLANFAHHTGRYQIEAGEALRRSIELMFHNGDFDRPNSYEHYNPITGTPSLYRGYDDYMHSWIVDLIMRHAVGVQPGQDDVQPLPLEGVALVACENIPHGGRLMHVRNGRVEFTTPS